MSGNEKGLSQSELITEFMELQRDKISLEKSELNLKAAHLENQRILAQQSLNVQEKLLEKAPSESRKDKLVLFGFITVITIAILLFAAFCLDREHEEFITYLIGALSHIAALVIGYYFGNNKNTPNPSLEDAEIVE